MRTRMQKLPARYIQIFIAIQKMQQHEMQQNSPCAKDPHKNNIKHYHTRKQTSFITPVIKQTQPLQTNLTKPPVPLTLIILPSPLLIYTLIPISQFYPTPTLWPRAPPTQTPSNPHQQDTISVGSTLLYNHPPQYKQQNDQKSNWIHMINFFLF